MRYNQEKPSGVTAVTHCLEVFMKRTTLQRLNRTAFIAFPLATGLLLLSWLLDGMSTIMILIWAVSLGLLAVVLLACITRNVVQRWQAGNFKPLILRWCVVAAAVFGVLVLMDLTTDRIFWSADIAVAALTGFLSWYSKP